MVDSARKRLYRAVFLSYSPRIIAYAIKHLRMGEHGKNYHYPDCIYAQVGNCLAPRLHATAIVLSSSSRLCAASFPLPRAIARYGSIVNCASV